MARTPGADELKAMAEHRGLKLVRSRKRTPGVGDYGKFGLTDINGKALLGIGGDGLTASADEIENYLRGGAVSSWKLSAETTPDRPPPKAKRAEAEPDPDEQEAPVRRRGRQPPKRKSPERTPPRRGPRVKPELRLVPKAEPEPAARPEPEPKLRAARAGDAKTLTYFLDQLADNRETAADIAAGLRSLRGAKAGLIVAELGAIIGCCAWAAVPTLQNGLLGRITLLLVDADHRREGLGSALLAAAEKGLANAGCRDVEVMSDIMIANSHNFFRTLGFEQKSYRFVRRISR